MSMAERESIDVPSMGRVPSYRVMSCCVVAYLIFLQDALTFDWSLKGLNEFGVFYQPEDCWRPGWPALFKLNPR